MFFPQIHSAAHFSLHSNLSSEDSSPARPSPTTHPNVAGTPYTLPTPHSSILLPVTSASYRHQAPGTTQYIYLLLSASCTESIINLSVLLTEASMVPKYPCRCSMCEQHSQGASEWLSTPPDPSFPLCCPHHLLPSTIYLPGPERPLCPAQCGQDSAGRMTGPWPALSQTEVTAALGCDEKGVAHPLVNPSWDTPSQTRLQLAGDLCDQQTPDAHR